MISPSVILLATTLALIIYFLYVNTNKKRVGGVVGIERYEGNPILSPEYGDWDAIGVFNPAAILDDDSKVHVIYRAIGNDGVSRFGYAKSNNGKDFKEKSSYPVFATQNPRRGMLSSDERTFNPVMYPSGGSWGGSEDPRMVRIDGKVYLSFSAFDGWDFIRIAVSSIDEDDFFNKRWKWSSPMFISPAGEIHKNWVLFPEKIGGKFAILHSISPRVQIDFVDSLEELHNGSKTIRSRFGRKTPRRAWDAWPRGVGPPPIKTEEGWLVLYHTTTKDDGRYRVGGMLLDLKNPKKIIARSKGPLLSPDMWYENDWKPGVVFACGAIVKDEELFVYYGGGDKYTAVATTNLNTFLSGLKGENLNNTHV